MTTETTEKIDILKWLATAELTEVPAPGTSPEAPGGPGYEDSEDGEDEDEEEDQDDEEDSA